MSKVRSPCFRKRIAISKKRASRPLSLRRNFTWNFAGNVVYAVCQWGMLVVLAKLTTPEQVGLFTLGLAVTAPIFIFSQLQLRGVQATDVRDEFQFGHYLGLRFVTTLAAFLVLGAVLGFSSYDRTAVLVILAVALSKAFESIADVFYGLLQRHERMDRIARSRIIKGPLALSLMAIIVHTTGNVAAGTLGLAATWGIVLIVYDLHNASKTLTETKATGDNSPHVRAIFQIGSLARLAWLALPLGLTMALLSLKTNIPRYFIEHHLGPAQLGYFAALAYLMMAANTVTAAMGQTCVPRLAKYYAAGNIRAYRNLLLRLIAIGAGIGLAGVVGALLFGRWILSILYTPDYAQYSNLFVWLTFVTGFSIMSSFMGYAITAARYFKIQVPLNALYTLATGIIAWFMVADMGLEGAIIAIASGICIKLFLSSLLLFRIIRQCCAREKVEEECIPSASSTFSAA